MNLLLAAIAIIYAVASAVTFVAYGLDKRAARLGRWRIPERRLHLFELAGGWPGALLAQRAFRHKTRDPGFRRVFMAIIGLHVALWITAAGLWMRGCGQPPQAPTAAAVWGQSHANTAPVINPCTTPSKVADITA